MRNNYDKIASMYDLLSRMVFGRAQVKAQIALLPYIEKGNRILIIGGGTGWVLEELTKLFPSGLQITYVEISANMLELSKQRNVGENEVVFIQSAIENCQFNAASFDIIFTAFLFDNFKEDKGRTVFTLLNNWLNPSGRWLYIDFQYTDTHGWWQRIMLQSMLLFFRFVSKVEATHLVDMTVLFRNAGYEVLFKTERYKGFIGAIVYRKLAVNNDAVSA
ncbi:class I SAM-dependent methyltransferase [Taibaiella soli]|uniref:Methyltransferase type 12 n=1 Tax=Taibaiella soli TaxID=1649169 RepID=A0A2W2BBM2_9BACT|nr:class I SAM-dependent methyltransferase [Taibaiella soli]PZF73609.1 methyltransferase type 12 [Taibaiella soli]